MVGNGNPIVKGYREEVILPHGLQPFVRELLQGLKDALELHFLLLWSLNSENLWRAFTDASKAPDVHAVMSKLSEKQVMHCIYQSELGRIPVLETKELRPAQTVIIKNLLTCALHHSVSPFLCDGKMLRPRPACWPSGSVRVRDVLLS